MALRGPVAVIGCGLIGGSLLKALQRNGVSLVAVDVDQRTVDDVTATGIPASADFGSIAGATVVVLALPVMTLLDRLPHVAKALRETHDVVVTDVAGIKVPVLEAMRKHLTGVAHFVGGHPMAGKERGGFRESDPDLFTGKRVALCPDTTQAATATDVVARLWHEVGARTLSCEASEHDEAVARVSHLPHLVAASLSAVAGRGTSLSDLLASSGLRDTTRVAEDRTIREAIARNPSVAELTRDVARELLALADALEQGSDIGERLDEAAAARRRIFAPRD